MIKKHINTFEGGLDQDMDKKVVAKNKYYSARNFTLTKDGKAGILSTFNGYQEPTGATNINLDNDVIVYHLTFDNTISSGATLFRLDDAAVNITASTTLNTVGALALDLKSSLSAYSNYYVYRRGDEVVLYVYETISNINANLTLLKTFGVDTSTGILNLSMLEVNITGSERLIFLWRRDINGTFLLQIVHYDNGRNIFFDSAIIYKGDLNCEQFHNDNIIYTKELSNKHVIYWNDGVNPDRKILINKSITKSDYPSLDFQEFADVIRDDIYPKSESNFTEKDIKFFPKPRVYRVYQQNTPFENNNGQLKPTETVIYFYRLIQDGSNSNISPYTEPLMIPTNPLTKDGEYIDNLKFTNYQDSNFSGPTNTWSVEFSVEGLTELPYDFIESYVIHYNREGEFKVRKLETIPNNKSIQVISYNRNYDTETGTEVDLDTLTKLNPSENICGEQIIFKNRRIKANLKDTTVDALLNFDARAYRFTAAAGTQEANLYNTLGDLEATIDGTAPDWDIEDKLDLINPYNDEFGMGNIVTDNADWLANQQYLYQANGTTVGGEGPNISYVFQNTIKGTSKLESTVLSELSGSKIKSTSRVTNRFANGDEVDNSHRVPLSTKTFQGGEVYRFFLFFWRGDAPTLSKWIADIKIPENDTMVDSSAFDNEISSKVIEFTINTTSFIGEASAISIGFVPKPLSDSTVLCTTTDIGTKFNNSSNYIHFDPVEVESDTLHTQATGGWTGPQIADHTLLKNLVVFPFDLEKFGVISPDIESSDLYLKKLAYLDNTQYTQDTETSGTGTYPTLTDGDSLIAFNNAVPYPTQESISVFNNKQITSKIFLSSIRTDLTDLVPGVFNADIVFSNNTLYDTTAPVGTKLLPQFNGFVDNQSTLQPRYGIGLSTPWSTLQSNKTSLISVRRPLVNQYGGDSYESRLANTVQMANYVEIENNTSVVVTYPEGDCYTCYADLLMEIGTSGPGGLGGPHDWMMFRRGLMIPVESPINFHARDTESVEYRCPRWAQTGGDISTTGITELLDQTSFGLYPSNITFNTANIENRGIRNTSVPITENILSEYASKINISAPKILGELSDSWLEFKVNDSKIIDPVNGDIIKLVNVKDALYVMQEHGIARQYVEQIQQQIEDVSEISLGTGDVAGQHIYILRNTGVQNTDDVIQLPDDIIFRDLTRKKLYSLNNGEIPGLSQLFINDSYTGPERRITYDRETNMVFIPNYVDFLESSDSYLIGYDNNIKKITSSNSFVADFSNSVSYTGLTNLLSFSGGDFKVFNKNVYADYPSVTIGPQISLIVNPEPSIVKTFDTLLIDMEGIEYDGDLLPVDDFDLKPTFIRCKTQYQDTGLIPTTDVNMKRKGRYWKFTIPRDTGTRERLRDYYMEVTLLFNDTIDAAGVQDREIKLNTVITSYRKSNLGSI